MKYSYIKPRKKSALTQEMLLSFTFFSITLVMLLLTYLFLAYKNYAYVSDTILLKDERALLEKSIEKMKSEIVFIEKQRAFAQKVTTQNSVLKDSITNLFDLVPQRITLSEAKLLENGLILYGVTPSKDIYNFMLHAPLRSIFHRTYSSFYPAQNGWLNFVSTNYTDKEEELDSEN